MKPRHYIRLNLLSCLCLIIAGCEIEPFGEDNIIKDSLTIQEEFQLNFSLENFDDPSGHIVDNIEVNWDNYETKIYAEKEWYEFEVIQQKPITYNGNGEIQGQFLTLLAHKNEDGIKYFINKMLSFQNGKDYTHFNIEEKYYGGMVYLYNMQGEAEYLFHFEKGVAWHSVESTKVKSETTNSLGLVARGDCHQKGNTARCDDALSCGIAVGSGGSSNSGSCGNAAGGATGWVQVVTYHYTEWYNNNGDSYSYNGRTEDGYTSEWIWISGSSYNDSMTTWSYAETSGSGPNLDGYRSGEVTYLDNPPRGVEKRDIIIYDSSLKTNPCVKNVIQNLINLDDNLLKSTIGKFVKNPDYNLRFKIGDCKTTDEACTDGTKIDTTGEVIITLENTGQSTIGIASLLIHEGIHAEMYRYISQYKQGINPSDKSEIFRWYKHYAEYYGDVFNHPNPSIPKNAIDHAYMTQYYIIPIANALRKLDNNKYHLDYYKDYAWDGLRAWAPSGGTQYDSNLAQYRATVEASAQKCN